MGVSGVFKSFVMGTLSVCVGASNAYAFQRIQHTLEMGPELYTQGASSSFYPDISGRLSFATRYDIADWFSIVGRTTASGFNSSLGAWGAAATSPYFGFSAGYNPSIRIKTDVEGFIPYLEGGVSAGLYFVSLRQAPTGISGNQLALKPGITAGLGFDWFASQSDGLWGLGLGLTYFMVFSGPAFLDFPIGPVSASGYRADLHITLKL